ncbi:MAG: hypothetical protein JNK45_06360 [Myxococcales bacterium]|nr:hypothetical protein [Myxococcales bacterium]
MIRCLAASLAAALALPSAAHARREPSPTDAGAPIPVGPAAAPPSVGPAAAPPGVAPAPSIAEPTPTPVAAAPAAWEPAPTPAPVVQSSPVPPPRPIGPPPPPVRVTEGNDLIAAGLASFGGFYFFTSLAGAVIIDKARDRKTDAYTGEKQELDTRRLNYGRALLVPVAGPFIGLAYTSSAKERWAAALTGAVQVTGVVLTMVGLTQKARARRAQRYSVGAQVAAGTAMLSLGGRF